MSYHLAFSYTLMFSCNRKPCNNADCISELNPHEQSNPLSVEEEEGEEENECY
jgi:hypothetical protein